MNLSPAPLKHQAVLFDLDYTLWDHAAAQENAIRKVCEKHDLDFEVFHPVYVKHNWEVWRAFAAGTLKIEEGRILRFSRTLEKIRVSNRSPETLSRDYLSFYPLEVFLIDGAEEILALLSPHFIMGIITNGTLNTQNGKLDRSRIRQYFDFMVTVDDAGCSKPEKAFFDLAFQKAGVPRDAIVCMGDNFYEDIVGSARAGAGTTVWFNPEKYEVPEEYGVLPDYNISRLEELVPILLETK